MNSIVNLAKRFLHADVPEKPSMIWQVQRGFTFFTMNQLLGWSIPFARRNHFQITELRKGYLQARIPIKGNKNHLGTMYAGAEFLLTEVPGGIISIFEFGSGYFPILKEITIRYLLPATSDLTIELSMTQAELDEIQMKADQNGKCDFTLNLDLKDVNDVVVAQSVALYQLRFKHKT
jgi:acyl-coenzyme A thioesterase PaaI-like protein